MAPYACYAKFGGLPQENTWGEKGQPFTSCSEQEQHGKRHMPKKGAFKRCAKFHTASAHSYLRVLLLLIF